MSPDDIPTEITSLAYTAPGPTMSQNQVAEVLAHYWPAIERHIRNRKPTATFPSRVVLQAATHGAMSAPDGTLITACGHATDRPVTCPGCAQEMNPDVQPTGWLPAGVRMQDVPHELVMATIRADGNMSWDRARGLLAIILPMAEQHVRDDGLD